MNGRDPTIEAMWPVRYEDHLFRAFGVDPQAFAAERGWVRAFRELSSAIQKVEAEGGSSGPRKDEGGDLQLLRALVYGQRTYLWVRRLQRWLGSVDRELWDLGGGTGAGALAWTDGGARQAVVVDHADPGPARALWSGLEASIRFEPGNLRSGVEGGRTALWAFSLREAFPRPRQAAEHLVTWWQKGHCGLVLEPGTRISARWVQEVRDALKDRVPVAGPCRAQGACPRNAGGSDWCHFSWRIGHGPEATRLLQRAGRDPSVLHASWLALGEGGPSSGHRLLDVRPKGKVLRLHFCSPQGETVGEVARRDRARWRQMRTWRPGDRVEDRQLDLGTSQTVRWTQGAGPTRVESD